MLIQWQLSEWALHSKKVWVQNFFSRTFLFIWFVFILFGQPRSVFLNICNQLICKVKSLWPWLVEMSFQKRILCFANLRSRQSKFKSPHLHQILFYRYIPKWSWILPFVPPYSSGSTSLPSCSWSSLKSPSFRIWKFNH